MKAHARLPLGAATWTFGRLPPVEIARRAVALELDGVEMQSDVEFYSAPEVRRVLREHGLEVLSINTVDADMAHPDPQIRSRAVESYCRQLEFAAELGHPLFNCHTPVGRVRPVSTLAEERGLFMDSVARISERARALGIRIVLEVLNRYEAHLLNTAGDALDFLRELAAGNAGLLLDAYHMNIEEPDPAAAICAAGSRLWLYHCADSNRQGVGRGHIDFASQLAALRSIGYAGPVILECTAPGPDPFTAIKGEDSLFWLETYLSESVAWLRPALLKY